MTAQKGKDLLLKIDTNGLLKNLTSTLVSHRDTSLRKAAAEALAWCNKNEVDVVPALTAAYLSGRIAEYEKNHPGVHILRINPGYDQFRPKLKTMMSAGTPPDIFYLPPDILPEMASLKLLRPIDDYVAQERASGQGGYLDEFWPILMKAWRFDVKTGQIGTGQLYGLPKDFTTTVMYVNLDLVEGHQLQLTNADGSRTFAAIHMHANRLYILEGTVPKGAPQPALFQQSLGFIDKDGKRIRYSEIYSNAYPPPTRTR